MLNKFGTQKARFCSDAENIPDQPHTVEDAVSKAMTTRKGALFLYIWGISYSGSCLTDTILISSIVHTWRTLETFRKSPRR